MSEKRIQNSLQGQANGVIRLLRIRRDMCLDFWLNFSGEGLLCFAEKAFNHIWPFGSFGIELDEFPFEFSSAVLVTIVDKEVTSVEVFVLSEDEAFLGCGSEVLFDSLKLFLRFACRCVPLVGSLTRLKDSPTERWRGCMYQRIRRVCGMLPRLLTSDPWGQRCEVSHPRYLDTVIWFLSGLDQGRIGNLLGRCPCRYRGFSS